MALFRINLIRSRVGSARFRRSVSLALVVYSVLWCTATAWLLVTWITTSWTVQAQRHRIALYEKETREAEPALARFSSAEKEKNELLAELAELDTLQGERTHWAQMLQAVADSVPSAAWIREIQVDHQVSVSGSDPANRVRIDQPIVRLHASAWDLSPGGRNEADPVRCFSRSLSEHPLVRPVLREFRLVRCERMTSNDRLALRFDIDCFLTPLETKMKD